ncbi:MAG: hypothetical protein H6702_16190 [Myxococcales bacterium]|nr:hypothetical protein [Myxococcales bacterium]
MRTLALWLPLLALGCGAAPVSPDPCAHGGCQAGPLEVPPEEQTTAGQQGKPGKRLRDEDQADVLRCKALMAENPSMAPAQCRVKVGPLRIGPNQGPNSVGVTVTNTEPTDLENPRRLNVEGEADPEGRR